MIYGNLCRANGHVMVAESKRDIGRAQEAKIDTKGFVASTLDLRDSAFHERGGTLTLVREIPRRVVRNEGTIQALGGDVFFLIGNTVENSGTISAPARPQSGLAAGSSVKLVQAGERNEFRFWRGNANGGCGERRFIMLAQSRGASAELKAAGWEYLRAGN